MAGALVDTLWRFGTGMAAQHLATTRAACQRMATVAEGAVQALDSASRMVRPEGAGAFVPRDWAGLRRIAHQLVAGSETNLRAGFDCAERLVAAAGPRDFLALQATYIRDQSRRTAQQMVDLQRIASDVTFGRATGTAPAAPQPEPGAAVDRRERDARPDVAAGAGIPFRRGRTRGHAQSRFHDIAYVDWGDPDRPDVVLCVHGLTRQGRDFDALAQALAARGRRVVCPDVVGRGRSGRLKDPDGYSLPQYVSDMALLIAHLGVEQVDWVGTSMGGVIGMALAASEATPVRRLVINDIGAFLPHGPVRAIGNNLLEAPARYASLEEAEARLRRIHAPFGPLTDAQWRHLTEHSVVADGTGGFLPHYDRAIGDAFRPGRVYDTSLWEMWDAITCPVLLLRGAASDLLLAETADEMTRRGPRATLVTLPECGHAPALLDAGQIRIVADWLLGPR